MRTHNVTFGTSASLSIDLGRRTPDSAIQPGSQTEDRFTPSTSFDQPSPDIDTVSFGSSSGVNDHVEARSQRLALLKESISSGAYQVPVVALADKILAATRARVANTASPTVATE